MSIVVNTNINSLMVQNSLAKATAGISSSLQKLSTGYRINSAADDAAGLTISEKLKSQENGYGVALNNSQDGINMLQIADGDLSTIQSNLQRIRDLAVQAANDTNGTSERSAIKSEIDQRVTEIDKVASGSKFNGKGLLDGSATSVNIQIGANATANDVLDISSALTKATSTGLSIDAASHEIKVDSFTDAKAAITSVDKAISAVSTQRSTIGSYVNSLNSAIDSATTRQTNISAAGSRIRDVDVAKEAASLTKNQILQQASAQLLAQANASPQVALSLL
jgi:flagellin